jgi:predicted permease
MLEDIQFGLRLLCWSPGFTVAVILTLGLGIGLNTAIYSIINGFLRPLPVKDPKQLVVLAARDKHAEFPHGLSYSDFRDYRGLTGVFSDVLARHEWPIPANMKRSNQTERIWVDAVTTNYFSLLGVSPVLGRTFLPDENRTNVAVLDYRCWQQRFGRDPDIAGKALDFNGQSFTVIGVAPQYFEGTQVSMHPEVYVPLQAFVASAAGGQEKLEQRDDHELRVLARLKPGVSVAQARAAVNVVAGQLERQYPDTNKGVHVITVPERFARPEPQVSEATPAIAVFSMVMVGLVLLIACANVSNLLLVRAARRSKEMALRTAIGASRFRIVRLLLTESLILGLLGGGAGVLIAEWGTTLMGSRPPSIDFPVHMDWTPDGQVLLYATCIALLTGIICGLMPALEISRPDLSVALKQGIGQAPGRKRWLSSLFVTGQVGFSMLLLIVAGLFIRGAQKAENADLGFDRNNLQLLSVDLTKQNYDKTRGREFIRGVLEEIQSLPGVRSVSVAKFIPFDQQGNEALFSDEQAAFQRADAVPVLSNTVGLNYFQVMGIPVLKGRDFGEHDDDLATRVAVINEALALQFWHGKDPLGRIIRTINGDTLQVIGVVKTGKYAFLTEQPRPYLYLPFRQNYSSPATFHIRTTGNPANLVSALREKVRALDPDLPLYNVKTMQDHLQKGYLFGAIVLGGTLSGLFGLLGLTLACIGLYGVVSNTVNQRTREIGVRTALGASRGNILRVVLKQGMLLVLIGTTAGLAGGLAVAQLLKRVLFSVDPAEPMAFAFAILILLAVALLACLIPARRAARVDPSEALRYE